MSTIGVCVICKKVKAEEKLGLVYESGAKTLSLAILAERNHNISPLVSENLIHPSCRKFYVRLASRSANKKIKISVGQSKLKK